MKKVVLILVLFLVPLQAQARKMFTPKLFVNIDRACAPLTYIDNTIPNVIECLRHELTNSSNYTPGWSKYVFADIQLKLIGDAIEKYPIKTATRQSEAIAEKIARPVLDKIYEFALEEIKKQPGLETTVFPASELKVLRYE